MIRWASVLTGAFLLTLSLSVTSSANPTLVPGVWKTLYRDSVTSPWCTQGMAIDPSNPSTLYFCSLQKGLFKSTDGGGNWRRIGKIARDWHNLDTIDGTIRVRVDPKNPNHLYVGQGVGGIIGFYVSDNGGDSIYTPKGFTDFCQTQGIFGSDIYDIAVDPADFKHVLLSSHSAWAWGSASYGNGSGVLESKDGGNTWRACAMQPSWGTGTNVWFLDNGATWLLGTQANGYWRTSDSGKTWKQVANGPNGWEMSLSHGGGQLYKAKTGVLYATCATGIMRSTDNGLTWNIISGGSAPSFCGGIGSDGTYLYSKKAYGGPVESFSRSLESDGLTWTSYPQGGSFASGPFEMVYDSVNAILYSSCWGDGIIAMKKPSSAITAPSAMFITKVSPVKSKSRLIVTYGRRLDGQELYSLSGTKIRRVESNRLRIIVQK